ncbi:hypothetical protein VZT92_004376 [Zoarces viviparus]|uniref:Uncharacterized protein n=1 Tax=Zoarces viviparus TaxID=48416 RepID=A0AAW1FY64_ZOAVI
MGEARFLRQGRHTLLQASKVISTDLLRPRDHTTLGPNAAELKIDRLIAARDDDCIWCNEWDVWVSSVWWWLVLLNLPKKMKTFSCSWTGTFSFFPVVVVFVCLSPDVTA